MNDDDRGRRAMKTAIPLNFLLRILPECEKPLPIGEVMCGDPPTDIGGGVLIGGRRMLVLLDDRGLDDLFNAIKENMEIAQDRYAKTKHPFYKTAERHLTSFLCGLWRGAEMMDTERQRKEEEK